MQPFSLWDFCHWQSLLYSNHDNMVEVKNLTKRFKNNLAVNNLSFEINGGEVFGCLGQNGAGKTTTIRLILGLLEPTSGKATAWGKSLGNHPELRRKVGVLLENDGLYDNLSATANLDYYGKLFEVEKRKEKIKQALEFADLGHRQNDKVGTYSKGMRRKLGLVRSILHRPSILMLDEPSAGLDPEAQKMVRDLILNLAKEQEMLIFLNSHDLGEVDRICDRIIILKHGEIIAYDSLDNLRNNYREPLVEITLEDSKSASRAVTVLETVGFVSHLTSSGNKVTAFLKEDRTSELIFQLVAVGVRVEEVKRLSRSLEDIYLDVICHEETQ